VAGGNSGRSFIGAGPYGKRTVTVSSSRDCEAVRRDLQSERRWFRTYPPEGEYVVRGDLEGDRVRLVVMADHRDDRRLEFRGSIEPTADGGTQVSGVMQTHPGYRWFVVPTLAVMTLGLVTFLAFRVADGGSLLHPFFFTAITLGWFVGTLTAVVPVLLGDTFEGSADAIVAYLEQKVGGEVTVA
jgi:hypothetical protein